MPRPRRLALGGGCYHVINRGNGRAVVFHKEADFLAFERVLSLAWAHRGGQAPFRNNAETEPDLHAPARPLAHWLVRGPIERPDPWLRFVNREEEAEELARLRECVNRGSPYGDPKWRENAARKLGLESTIRPRGRPSHEK